MIGRQRCYPAAVEVNGFANEDALVAQERGFRAGNLGEIRPDFPVENILLQDFQRRLRRVHGNRLVAHPSYSIHQKRYMTDMVKMRMSNKNMIDPGELLEAEIAHPGAGVN